MAWGLLLGSAVLEAVWATALSRSHGLTEPVAVAVFVVALVASMAGLARAATTLPMGTAYAVWVGVGAALTVGIALVTGEEPFSLLRLVFLLGIVAAVIGLKVVGEREERTQPDEKTLTDPGR